MNPPYQAKRRALEKAAGGSGGIHSSAADLAKWLIFNMNEGSVGNTQLVSVKNMNVIHSPQNLITTKSSPKGKSEQAYGQGWVMDTQKYRPYRVLYHTGGGMGMHSFMAYIPEKKIGIAILTNTWGNKVPEALYQRFFDLCLKQKTLKDWSQVYLQEQVADVARANAEPQPYCQPIKASDLEKYVGTYYNPVFGRLEQSKQRNHLYSTLAQSASSGGSPIVRIMFFKPTGQILMG